MLVLTRKPNQSIMIGDNIVITVLEVKGDQIRIGITAPRDVQVYREEVLAALAQANRDSLLVQGTVAPAAPRVGLDSVRSRPQPARRRSSAA